MTNSAPSSPAGSGTELNAVDATVIVKVGRGESGGGFELFEVHAIRGMASPLHAEPWDKAYYVLTGRLEVQVDAEVHDLGPGSAINVRAGSANSFVARTPSATFLAFSLTDAMGRFFADLDRTVPAGRSLEQVVPDLLEVTERHGITFAGPAVGATP